MSLNECNNKSSLGATIPPPTPVASSIQTPPSTPTSSASQQAGADYHFHHGEGAHRFSKSKIHTKRCSEHPPPEPRKHQAKRNPAFKLKKGEKQRREAVEPEATPGQSTKRTLSKSQLFQIYAAFLLPNGQCKPREGRGKNRMKRSPFSGLKSRRTANQQRE
ncbi:uncharacterized protein LTR77_007028 [Saxophila tyrrhenica]|uniref:Uncharacterized protein n=1 Tax=Saxophila tyrrhenica TaxID=1690608 RepID=A0AAV9P6H6_9PEZI|nr:hypothetical protein LTR77_007028 [Saxophila tyrrhenica]